MNVKTRFLLHLPVVGLYWGYISIKLTLGVHGFSYVTVPVEWRTSLAMHLVFSMQPNSILILEVFTQVLLVKEREQVSNCQTNAKIYRLQLTSWLNQLFTGCYEYEADTNTSIKVNERTIMSVQNTMEKLLIKSRDWYEALHLIDQKLFHLITIFAFEMLIFRQWNESFMMMQEKQVLLLCQ